MLKPQDLLVALKLLTAAEEDRTFPRLAAALGMSASEVHASVKRAVASGLVNPEARTARKAALLEFLVHGVRYVFPP
jgi:predicted transcriptional regulator